MKKKFLFKTDKAEDVYQYILKNKYGMQVEIISIGASLRSILVPDKNGGLTDVILGHQKAETYLQNPAYLGAVVGRYANRIGHAAFDFHGRKIELEKNIGEHHLHSASAGFAFKVWQELAAAENKITLGIRAADGDGNYPGDIECRVTYQLTDDNDLKIDYLITTETETVANSH